MAEKQDCISSKKVNPAQPCPTVGILTTNFKKCQNSPGLPAPPCKGENIDRCIKPGLDSFVKDGLDSFSKTLTGLICKTWTRLICKTWTGLICKTWTGPFVKHGLAHL